MKENKYIISYSIQLVLTLAVLGAVIWYAQIMPINTPLVSAFNFDLAQFGIIIGLVIICLVYIFILVGFLVAAIRQKKKGVIIILFRLRESFFLLCLCSLLHLYLHYHF